MSKSSLLLTTGAIVAFGAAIFTVTEKLSISDSLYFTSITLSTTGFGDITPSNQNSKVIVMILSLIGFGIFAELIKELSTWRDNASFKSPVLQAIALQMFVLGIGTVAFQYFERISYFDSLYLSVMTATSIGYGDIYPRTFEGKMFSILYALLGMGVLSYASLEIGHSLRRNIFGNN